MIDPGHRLGCTTVREQRFHLPFLYYSIDQEHCLHSIQLNLERLKHCPLPKTFPDPKR